MFLNREKEKLRIQNALAREKKQLIVLYGRRRCGKSTLLSQVLPESTIFFSADLRESPLQIASFAQQAEKCVPGFSTAVYPDWDSVLVSLNNGLKEPTIVCIDEFPYLVKNCQELPSILQNVIDKQLDRKYHLILCGSSQQMIYSMVLDSSSPLYGRSDEIMNIKPMSIRNMKDFMELEPDETVKEYGVWGGVPRYWEIRKQYGDFASAVKTSILDQNGLLYEEPERLFIDEMRTSVQAYSILSLIGSGVHRPSEIAARLGKPVTQLSRSLAFLVNQGYIRREIPFGEAERTSKKSLYKIDDPFLNFYFTYLVPNKSRLQFDLVDQVWQQVETTYNQFILNTWESLCRRIVPLITLDGLTFNPAYRWWGTALDRKKMEIDVLALSTDKSTLLVGEVKWSDNNLAGEVYESISSKIMKIPFPKPQKIIKVLFQKLPATHHDMLVFTPEDVIGFL